MNAEFSVLTDQHAVRGYNFALGLTRNEQNARDLVQQTLLKVLKHFKAYDRARPFGPWFNRILKNVFLDGVRKIENKIVMSLDAPSPVGDMDWSQFIPGPDSTPLEQMEKTEMNNFLRKALNMLPDLYRSPLVLCDVERYSYLDIAKALKCPLGTVRSRIHHGRVLLRENFERLVACN